MTPGDEGAASSAGWRWRPARSAGGEALDTLLVAGGRGARHARNRWWSTGAAAGDVRGVVVLAGAFLLAAQDCRTGVARDLHWKDCAVGLARPAVRVEPDPIFARDGPVWTSAGVMAGDRSGAGARRRRPRLLCGARLGPLPRRVPQASRAEQAHQRRSSCRLQTIPGTLHDWINGASGRRSARRVLADQAGMSERVSSRQLMPRRRGKRRPAPSRS